MPAALLLLLLAALATAATAVELSTVPAAGLVGEGDSVTATVTVPEATPPLAAAGGCSVNGGAAEATAADDDTVTIAYTASAADDNGGLVFACDLVDALGAVYAVPDAPDVVVDTQPPSLAAAVTSQVAQPATAGDVITVALTVSDLDPAAAATACTLNGAAVDPAAPSHTVLADEEERSAGAIPLECALEDSLGHSTTALVYLADAAIDLAAPVVTAVTYEGPAVAGVGAEMAVSLTVVDVDPEVAVACTINGFAAPYTVSAGDPEHSSATPLSCTVSDRAGFSASLDETLEAGVDSAAPELAWADLVFASTFPARVGSVVTVSVDAGEEGLTVLAAAVNDVDVTATTSELDGRVTAVYTVADGDADHASNASWPVAFLVADAGGNEAELAGDFAFPFAVDAHAPRMADVALVYASSAPAKVGTLIEVLMSLAEPESSPDVVVAGDCKINHKDVAASFAQSTPTDFLLSYVVGSGEADWDAGDLPLSCALADAAGNAYEVSGFTDGNDLAGRQIEADDVDYSDLRAVYQPPTALVIGFFVVCIASHSIAAVFPRLKLPLISGYLAAGVLAGPYVLALVPEEEIRLLRSVDEVALAYIAASAGSQMHLREMRTELRSIGWTSFFLTATEYVLGVGVMVACIPYMGFFGEMEHNERVAVALMAGSMMIARSPASALAIVSETGARGRFTNIALGATILLDVLCLPVYNVNSLVAASILGGETSAGELALRMVVQFFASLGGGLLFGRAMARCVFALSSELSRTVVFITLVFGVFVASHLVYDQLLDPLLFCLAIGFSITNFTPQHKSALQRLLKRLSALVYTAFFTLTGAALELDTILRVDFLLFAVLLVAVRIVGIVSGAQAAGRISGETPLRTRYLWMMFVTQAGVTLGLAKKVHLDFPGWGGVFVSLIVAVVIINQLIGPPLFKLALQLVGDSSTSTSNAEKKESSSSSPRKARHRAVAVVSHEGDARARALCGRLEEGGWSVAAAGVDADAAEIVSAARRPGVVVLMLGDDARSYDLALRLARHTTAVLPGHELRLVTLLRGNADMPWAREFGALARAESKASLFRWLQGSGWHGAVRLLLIEADATELSLLNVAVQTDLDARLLASTTSALQDAMRVSLVSPGGSPSRPGSPLPSVEMDLKLRSRSPSPRRLRGAAAAVRRVLGSPGGSPGGAGGAAGASSSSSSSSSKEMEMPKLLP